MFDICFELFRTVHATSTSYFHLFPRCPDSFAEYTLACYLDIPSLDRTYRASLLLVLLDMHATAILPPSS